MREVFPGALTVEEAAAIAADIGYRDFGDPLLASLIGRVRSVADVGLEPPSYARVEARPAGHPWHHDTGTGGHMGWCRYTSGILLTPPSSFEGGGLYFRDAPDVAIFHYCDLVVYDDALENEHCVTRSDGDRRVLIMFFTGKV